MAKPKNLKAEERARTGSGVLKQMRREGYIPSVVYGGGSDVKNVKVHAKTFRDMLNHAASDSILVTLDLDNSDTQLAFLQDVQHNALTGEILHVDFLAVNQDTSITANIPLELVGESEGVALGGQLEQMLHSLEISCLPKDLPENIEADISALDIGDALNIGEIADISALDIGDALNIGEITFPEGVVPTLGEDVVVAIVAKARTSQAEEDEAAEAEAAEGAVATEGDEASPEAAAAE
jgi:large subunit ribosomal protein L25